MLNWGYAVKPTGITPGKIGLYKIHARKALEKAQDTFLEEWLRRTNPTSGTNIKSRRISKLLKKGPIVETDKDTRMVMQLKGKETDIRIAAIQETGGIIRSKGKKLTVPKETMKRNVSKTGLVPKRIGKKSALVNPRLYARAQKVYRKTRTRQDWGVRYWLVDKVTIKPKHFWKDTIASARPKIINELTLALKTAWTAMWKT